MTEIMVRFSDNLSTIILHVAESLIRQKCLCRNDRTIVWEWE